MREVTRWETKAGTVCATIHEAEKQETLETLEEALESLEDVYWRDTGPKCVAAALYSAGYELFKRPPEASNG